MGHLDLIAAADALIEGQRLKGVRLEPAGGPADGRDAVVITKEEWKGVRRVARKQGVAVGEGDITLSREEGSRLAHGLRQCCTPDATLRRVLVVLGKNGGLMVTGAA